MGYSIVNILGGLLIVTSTMVVVSRTIRPPLSGTRSSRLSRGRAATPGSPPVPPSFSCGPRRPSSPR
ncbi:MAG: hypothetical protein ACLU37_04505 [Collinsella sp.]